MLRRNYLLAVLLGLVLGVLAFMMSVMLNDTGAPAPSGCTGSISFRIEEDGSVTSWCPEGVTK